MMDDDQTCPEHVLLLAMERAFRGPEYSATQTRDWRPQMERVLQCVRQNDLRVLALRENLDAVRSGWDAAVDELDDAHDTIDRLTAERDAAIAERDEAIKSSDAVCDSYAAENQRLSDERDEAHARIRHLEKAVREAPHDCLCGANRLRGDPCDCWKSRAVDGSEQPEPPK